MNSKEFAKYVARDRWCLHCGETDAIVPNHRANRGMGGSAVRNVPSNILVLCSSMNTLIESDAASATAARINGWKLSSWDDPLEVPVFDAVSGTWYLLDDAYHRTVLEGD